MQIKLKMNNLIVYQKNLYFCFAKISCSCWDALFQKVLSVPENHAEKICLSARTTNDNKLHYPIWSVFWNKDLGLATN